MEEDPSEWTRVFIGGTRRAGVCVVAVSTEDLNDAIMAATAVAEDTEWAREATSVDDLRAAMDCPGVDADLRAFIQRQIWEQEARDDRGMVSPQTHHTTTSASRVVTGRWRP